MAEMWRNRRWRKDGFHAGPLHTIDRGPGRPYWSKTALCGAYPDQNATHCMADEAPTDAKECPKCKRIKRERDEAPATIGTGASTDASFHGGDTHDTTEAKG